MTHYSLGFLPAPGLILASAAPVTAPARARVTFAGSVDLQNAEAGSAKLPTFSINAYNGGPMRVPFYFDPVVLDLSGIRAERPVLPILLEHRPADLVGQADQIRIDAAGINLAGTITGGADAPATRVVTHARNGFKWQASVGVDPLRVEYIEAGAAATVNGRAVNGPAIVVREGLLVETSFVAIGADSSTSAAVAATSQGVPSMNFEAWLRANGFDPATLTAAQRPALEAAYRASQAPAVPAPPAAPVTAAAAPAAPAAPVQAAAPAPAVNTAAEVRAEYTRIASIDRLCASAAAGQVVPLNGADVPVAQYREHAIAAGLPAADVELALLRASRNAAPAAHIGGGRDTLSAEVITAALCLTAGIADKHIAPRSPQSERERIINAAMARNMKGYSIHALMDHVIFAAGHHYSGNRKCDEFIEAAFRANRVVASSQFSSISLSGILGNVANTALAASYSAVEVTWPQIAAVRNHNDFKIHTRYRLDAKGAFRKVGADGELKHIELAEGSFTNQLDTFGAMVALTRQMQINDSLQAFLELPSLLGRMAALRLEEAVYVLLLSNPSSFFSTGNANYFEGASTNLQISSLTTAKQMFQDQVDSNGKPILVTPDRLLVPTSLTVTADNLYKELTIIASSLGSTSSRVVEPAVNPHRGLYRPISSPYLNNTAIKDQDGAAISGQSSTAWYLLSDPAVLAILAVAFLNGQQTPTLQSAETDFNTLGVQWRCFHDFGVGMEEKPAGIKSKGAA